MYVTHDPNCNIFFLIMTKKNILKLNLTSNAFFTIRVPEKKRYLDLITVFKKISFCLNRLQESGFKS